MKNAMKEAWNKFNNIEIGTISRIGYAESIEDLDCSVLHSIDSIFKRHNR
ncbi:hypothetical protein D2M30_2295 [Bacillus amyloliquefaciens]|nr:hypothetical protein D2M30_2295 [Bacillus amyloliquefaciens]